MSSGQPSQIKSLSDGLAKAYLEAFKLLDPNGNYTIESKDYFEILEGLGVQGISAQEFDDLQAGTDVDNEPAVNFAEYLSTVSKIKSDGPEEVAAAFEVFDRDGSTEITKENISEVMTAFGVELTEEELESIFEEGDKDKKGSLTLDEFIKVVNYAEQFIKKNGIPPGV
jgi:calmodulin